jgi:hypothetical protein
MWSFPGNAVSRVPLRLFDDRAAADAYRAECERLARIGRCPFTLAGAPWDLRAATSLPEELFRDIALGLGLTPPAADGDWQQAWRQAAPGMTEEFHQAVWDLLDRLRLHEVIELELED